MHQNFRFFAMHYLNDWFGYDRGFMAGLLPEVDPVTRLETLRAAATYYGVARNFRTIEGEERLAGALVALDAVPALVDETTDSILADLALHFKSVYGTNAVSAASKMLWLRHQWPVVIYDGQAVRCLKRHGSRFWDYGGFRKAWREEFAKREDEIRSACDELLSVKLFSWAADTPDNEFMPAVSSVWFRERVFDKFLWWNAG